MYNHSIYILFHSLYALYIIYMYTIFHYGLLQDIDTEHVYICIYVYISIYIHTHVYM